MTEPTEQQERPSRGSKAASETVAPSNHSAKAALTLKSRVCECGECGYFFSAPSAFDKHILGVGTDSPRCRTVRQMLGVGMITNENGVWLYGSSKEGAQL